MTTLQIKHSRILVDLFGRLKANCFAATFSDQALREFFVYCVMADAVYDAALENEITVTQCSYFVRDIWFFVVRFLLHSEFIKWGILCYN